MGVICHGFTQMNADLCSLLYEICCKLDLYDNLFELKSEPQFSCLKFMLE